MAVKKKQIRRLKKVPKSKGGLIIWSIALLGVGYGIWEVRYNKDIIFVSNEVRVLDGDTIELDKKLRIRFQGMDAPETKQECINRDTKEVWSCGITAKEALKVKIDNNEVSCSDEGKDRYGRQLSYCFVDGINLNAWMVREGYAVAYTDYDYSFILDEFWARWNNKGIWNSEFTEPKVWRKRKNK